MGECCSNERKNACCCHSHSEESCSHSANGSEDSHSKKLLEIADAAWMEALKEKMKQEILSTQGDRLSELAKVVVEANGQRWKQKMAKKRMCKEYEEKLCTLFCSK